MKAFAPSQDLVTTLAHYDFSPKCFFTTAKLAPFTSGPP